jgi:fructokinase
MGTEKIYGGIEAGGTKFVCIVGSSPSNIVDRLRIETASPQETLPRVAQFFEPYASSGRIRTLGIGSFGPIDLDRNSPNYGGITATPKPGWQSTNIPAALQTSLHLDVAIDTDVNAAALGEALWGAGRGVDPSLYLTIGTGIGGGFIQNGRPLHGLSHPEMGHIRVPHDRRADSFPGNCPFHGDCFEGLANGPAIEKRLGRRAETLADDDPFWQIEAAYIGAALATYILVLSPARIILGGGIMQRRFLLPVIRRHVLDSLNGYVQCAPLLERIESYIVPPQLGNESGALGALALARQAAVGSMSA